jgi:hypothetical protein
MRIIRGREAELASQKRSDTCTGGVWGDAVLSATDGVLVNNVSFEPRARTHRHRHERGCCGIRVGGGAAQPGGSSLSVWFSTKIPPSTRTVLPVR